MQYIVQLHILVCLIRHINEKFPQSQNKKEFIYKLLSFEGKSYAEFFEFLWEEVVSCRNSSFVFAIEDKLIEVILWKYFRFLSNDKQASARFKELFYSTQCLDSLSLALDLGLRAGVSQRVMIRKIIDFYYFPDPCLIGIKSFEVLGFRELSEEETMANYCIYDAIKENN